MVDNQKLKNRVKELCADERFVHHKWYFKYHLEIIERIVNELREFYPGANYETVESMIWCHDLEKIVRNQGVTPSEILAEIGFSEDEIANRVELTKTMDAHREIDLNKAIIEVKIISSADAAAHFVGPFYLIYWYENPTMTIENLMDGDLEKLERDWKRKVVLPEIKEFMRLRNSFQLEQHGVFPDKFLK